jgi:hypothetical protein
VSWIHPTVNVTEEKKKAVYDGFLHFREAVSPLPEPDGGMVAGWGQMDFEREGVPSLRFTALVGWKSVEAHFGCKKTAVFEANIHHLRGQGARGVEMVHYAFSNSSEG